jgi:hypothetical protein
MNLRTVASIVQLQTMFTTVLYLKSLLIVVLKQKLLYCIWLWVFDIILRFLLIWLYEHLTLKIQFVTIKSQIDIDTKSINTVVLLLSVTVKSLINTIKFINSVVPLLFVTVNSQIDFTKYINTVHVFLILNQTNTYTFFWNSKYSWL